MSSIESDSAADKTKGSSECSYEALRAANIKRNEEVMRALGLDDRDFILHEAHKNATKTPVKKRKMPEEDADLSSGVRRSARRLGIKASQIEINEEHHGGDDSEQRVSRENPLHASLADHSRAEEDYLRWAGKQKPATIVGTASYKHTLHRVRTMTEKALQNRIKAIERACGQHAVVKMKLFARVLCLEGYEELSSEATEAYQRLAAKLGEPSEEEVAAAADD